MNRETLFNLLTLIEENTSEVIDNLALAECYYDAEEAGIVQKGQRERLCSAVNRLMINSRIPLDKVNVELGSHFKQILNLSDRQG